MWFNGVYRNFRVVAQGSQSCLGSWLWSNIMNFCSSMVWGSPFLVITRFADHTPHLSLHRSHFWHIPFPIISQLQEFWPAKITQVPSLPETSNQYQNDIWDLGHPISNRHINIYNLPFLLDIGYWIWISQFYSYQLDIFHFSLKKTGISQLFTGAIWSTSPSKIHPDADPRWSFLGWARGFWNVTAASLTLGADGGMGTPPVGNQSEICAMFCPCFSIFPGAWSKC